MTDRLRNCTGLPLKEPTASQGCANGVDQIEITGASRRATQNNAFTGVAADNLGVNTRNDDISQDVDIVTARVNYRFGGPVSGQILIRS
jgi:hypothetical protein